MENATHICYVNKLPGVTFVLILNNTSPVGKTSFSLDLSFCKSTLAKLLTRLYDIDSVGPLLDSNSPKDAKESSAILINGKDIREVDGQLLLLDIDTPTFQIVEYPLDLEQGSLGRGRLVVDLENENLYPDGLIITPDGKSLIVALYNPMPGAETPGEVRQYSLAGQNQLEVVWQLPGAPQVTCPQLVHWNDKVQLLVTTAVEHMDADTLAIHSNSGGLFLAETEFADLRPTFQPT